jgi:hypothetical protein
MTEEKFPRGGGPEFKAIKGGRSSLEGNTVSTITPPIPTGAEIAEFCSPPIVTGEDKVGIGNEAILEILGTRNFLAGLFPKNPSADDHFGEFRELWRERREEEKREPFLPFREKLLTSATRALVLAKRITGWLESKHYPVVFARAVQEARKDIWNFVYVGFSKRGSVPGEVRDFLNDIEKCPVSLEDELTFARGDKFKPAVFSRKGLEILVPEGDLTGETEWSVYVGTLYAFLGRVFKGNEYRYAFGIRLYPKNEEEERRRDDIDSFIIDFFVCKFAVDKIRSGVRLKNKEQVLPSILDAKRFMAKLEEVKALLPDDLCAEAMVSDIELQMIRGMLFLGMFKESSANPGGDMGIEVSVEMRDFRDRLWRAGFKTITEK